MPRMSYESIQKQIQKLQAQAKKLEENHFARKAKAIAQVRALMKKLEISIEDLQESAQKPLRKTKIHDPVQPARKLAGRRGPVAPKYQDPLTGNTWTGRGKPPLWLASQLSTGRQKDEFLILTENKLTTLPDQATDAYTGSH